MSEFEFERGREAGVKWGERFEKERILGLIENVKCNHQQSIAATAGLPCSCQRCQIVALIKGENK